MRQKLLLLGLVAAAVSLPAMADDNYEDRGRVISVTPQVQRVNTPRQECRTEYVRESVYENRSRSNTGAVIGGVSGGLLGSTIGRGNGRVAAAVVGAGLGAIIGDRVDNDRGYDRGRERVVSRPVESCVTVDNWSQVPAGYLVNYEYNGRTYSTVTERDPGRFIPVNVAVRPNGYVTQVEYSQSRGNDKYDRGDREEHDGRGHRWDHNRHNDRHEGREHGYW